MTKATFVLLVALSPLGHGQSAGDLVAFGENLFGQTNVPPLPPGLSWTALSTCGYYSLALRSDGAVIPFGAVPGPILAVPATPPTAVVVDLAAGPFHALALLSDGNVLAWGDRTRPCPSRSPRARSSRGRRSASSRRFWTRLRLSASM